MTTAHAGRLSKGECAPDVPAPLGLAEIALRLGRDDPGEEPRQNRNAPSPAHLSGQERRLIESSLGESLGVKGDRDQPIHRLDVKVLQAGLRHELAEWASQRHLPPVLQGMDRRPQWLPIIRRGSGRGVRWGPTVTTLAEERLLHPYRIREPAPRAPRRRDGEDPSPAGTAERILAPLAEGSLTARTEGWEEKVEEWPEERDHLGLAAPMRRRRRGKRREGAGHRLN